MLNEAQIRELYPRADGAHIAAFAGRNAELFARFGISDNRLRLEFLLAQVGHESGGLTGLVENLDYRAAGIAKTWPKIFASEAEAAPFAHNPEKLANRVYAGKYGNRPSDSGDGYRFRGRGYIQLTFRDGYQQVGDLAGMDFASNPDSVLRPENALLAVCAFWKWKGLNAICDTGDFVKVTRRINGGEVGLPERRAWLDKVRRVLAAPLVPAVHQVSAAEVIAVQKALRAAGAKDIGAADGAIGPKTLAAIVEYRRSHGLAPATAPIDAALLKALGIA